MSLRTFTDSLGHEWQAFDVVPREDERRRFDRRSSSTESIESVDGTDDSDDRREGDRRLTIGGRVHLQSGAGAGWLVFENESERRRLAPIPENWPTASDAELEAYLSEARPVQKSAAFNSRR